MDTIDIPTPLASVANASIYQALLLSLMAINYTPRTKQTFKEEYDYIIVGAGTAGSVLAARLSEDPSVNVLLLEAGPSPPPITEVPAILTYLFGTYIDWNIFTTPQKHLNNRTILQSTGKVVGGSSILTYMLISRGNRKDYDDWAANGAAGWSYKDVLPYFKKLENYTVERYFNPEYHSKKGPLTIELPKYKTAAKDAAYETAKRSGIPFADVDAVRQYGFMESFSHARKGRRCATPKAYLVPANDRPNLDIIASAFVTKVIIENRRATGVSFEFNNDTHVVKAANEVILSAGALHTPQILMLSGIGPKDQLEQFQIPVLVDLAVGKNLHDHPLVFHPYGLSSDIPALKTIIKDPENIQNFIDKGEGPLSSIGGLHLTAFLSSQKNLSNDVVPENEIYFIDGGASEGANGSETVLMCCSQILQVRSKGTVTLQSANPHDQPLVDPNYFDDMTDLIDMARGLIFCDKFMNSTTFRNIRVKRVGAYDTGCNTTDEDKFAACVIRNGVATAYHPVGTAKMGDISDPTTVVDPQLKVKGIQQLRVVDASIIPQIPAANIHTPIVMIAEKAADLIKNAATTSS